ncbi:substrate-binding periplasmic protein [Neptuniibacter sp. QD34_54]|uniref:substrate-binding periplasmic protein n=1 Tax=Neptuniibacter sp. QD34_54 TaxID=3398208 RepID=UPI0039F5DF7A
MRLGWALGLFCVACNYLYADSDYARNNIQFLTHNLKKSVFKDYSGEIRGIEHAGRRAFNLELVRAMSDVRKLRFEPVEVPFLRGVDLVKQGPNYAIFNISRNEERENQFKWVGPLQSDSVQFFKNTRYPKQLTSYLEFTEEVRVCVLRGSRHEKILKAETPVLILVANSYNSCFRLLAEGRVDYTPVSLHEVSNVFKTSGVSEKIIKKTPIVLYRSEGYIAFSKQTPDEEIAEWQSALDQLKKDGEYDRLASQYLYPRE